MKIHNLTWKGIPMWPPEWSTCNLKSGEEGILEDVQIQNVFSKKEAARSSAKRRDLFPEKILLLSAMARNLSTS